MLLLNYGQNESGKSTENISSEDIIKTLPSKNINIHFSCKLGGCNLGNTSFQNTTYSQGAGSSMAENLSKNYKNSIIMKSGGKTNFGPIGAGRISPSSNGGYNYWWNGSVVKTQSPGEIPSSQKTLRSIDLPK